MVILYKHKNLPIILKKNISALEFIPIYFQIITMTS